MIKKRLILVCGSLVAVMLLGAAAVGAQAPNLTDKRKMLDEKRAEFQQLVAEYRGFKPEQHVEASVVGNKAKDLAPTIDALEREVEGVTDEKLTLTFRSIKAALRDGLAMAKQKGASPASIASIEARLQHVEKLEQEFAQRSRPNQNINTELDELLRSWK